MLTTEQKLNDIKVRLRASGFVGDPKYMYLTPEGTLEYQFPEEAIVLLFNSGIYIDKDVVLPYITELCIPLGISAGCTVTLPDLVTARSDISIAGILNAPKLKNAHQTISISGSAARDANIIAPKLYYVSRLRISDTYNKEFKQLKHIGSLNIIDADNISFPVLSTVGYLNITGGIVSINPNSPWGCGDAYIEKNASLQTKSMSVRRLNLTHAILVLDEISVAQLALWSGATLIVPKSYEETLMAKTRRACVVDPTDAIIYMEEE